VVVGENRHFGKTHAREFRQGPHRFGSLEFKSVDLCNSSVDTFNDRLFRCKFRPHLTVS
jgi:hypothetical protein